MKKLKLFCATLVGAICGLVLMRFTYPLLTEHLVGPIHGEDQMSLNASIFFIGVPVSMLIGAGLSYAAFTRFCSAHKTRHKRK